MFNRLRSGQVMALWLCYWVALFAVMHTPREHIPKIHVSNLDKGAHVTGYLLLALLGGAYAQRTRRQITFSWCASWVLAYGLYAAFDELTQPFFNRSAGVFDWLADILGVGIALTVVYLDSRVDTIKDAA